MYCSDLLPDESSTVDRLLVCCCLQQGILQGCHCEFANPTTNTQGFHPVCPKELVTKERSDDGWNTSCILELARILNNEGPFNIPRKLAPVVPAPP